MLYVLLQPGEDPSEVRIAGYLEADRIDSALRTVVRVLRNEGHEDATIEDQMVLVDREPFYTVVEVPNVRFDTP